MIHIVDKPKARPSKPVHFFSYSQLEIRINFILREFILMCFLYNNNTILHIFKKFTSECRSCFKKYIYIQFKLPLFAILNNQKLLHFGHLTKCLCFTCLSFQIISHNRSQISLDTVWWWHKCGDTLSKIAFFNSLCTLRSDRIHLLKWINKKSIN